MTKLQIAAVFSAALLSGISPPVQAQPAQCAKPAAMAEKIVCADKNLLEQDAKLATLYARAQEITPSPSALKTYQDNWRDSRNVCTDADCLSQSYGERIARLDDYIAAHEAAGDEATFVRRGTETTACPAIVLMDAPNVAPDCTVAVWKGLGEVGGAFRGYALYKVSYRWNDNDMLFYAPAILTADPYDTGVLRLDMLLTDVAGLQGEIDDPEKYVPAVKDDTLVFTFPALTDKTETRRYRLKDDTATRLDE